MRPFLARILVSSTSLLLAACAVDAASIDDEIDAPTGKIASAMAGPSIASLSRSSGIAGDVVTVTGSGFGATRGTSHVLFRGNYAPILSWSDAEIVCTVPPAATAGALNVWVTVGDLSSMTVPFTIIPSIGSITPGIVQPGDEITISGSNLGTTQRTSTITVGGVVATITSWSMRQVKALVPAGVNGTIPVVATVTEQASAPMNISTQVETNVTDHVAGREVTYKWLDTGSISDADKILADEWPTDRFADASLPAALTWTEDPYGDAYWRAQFYGFRPLRHLLAAYRATGDERYLDKLLFVLRSYAFSGEASAFSKDRLAAATRGLVLVNVYWKLAMAEKLSPTDAQMLTVLVDNTGRFLADPANYDARSERGLTESAALLSIGTNFPDLPSAASWRATAQSRFASYVDTTIDAEGVAFDRSTYQEFQLLANFWDPAVWSRTYAPETGAVLDGAIARMASTAAHVIQPDGKIPMVGQTPARDIRNAGGVFAEIGQAYPELAWSMSGGARGAKPASRFLDLASSGWTTMRSSWDQASFGQETQVFFDWRTANGAQADRDLLNVLVYSAGRPLIVDAGMFSSNAATAAWYRSTAAHNTVLVDGQSQAAAAAFGGPVATNEVHYPDSDPFARVAFHTAYAGVKHTRAVGMFAKDVVVVLDRLESDAPHTYEQIWHLAPEASQVSIDEEKGMATGANAQGTPLVRIVANYSTTTDDESYVPATSSALDGLQSSVQGQSTATNTVRYTVQGQKAVFATVILTGSRVSDVPNMWAWGDAQWSDAYVWSPESGLFMDRWLELDHEGGTAVIYDGP